MTLLTRFIATSVVVSDLTGSPAANAPQLPRDTRVSNQTPKTPTATATTMR